MLYQLKDSNREWDFAESTPNQLCSIQNFDFKSNKENMSFLKNSNPHYNFTSEGMIDSQSLNKLATQM